MKGYEIKDKETVWEGAFLKCLKISYLDSKGAQRKWESIERVNCEGVVAIVPVTENRELVLIRQFRPAVNNYVIEFPAGLNDKGEDLSVAASRELLEETGYNADEMIFLAEGPLSSGLSAEIMTVFLAKGLRFIDAAHSDETEEIEVLKIPIEEIYEAMSGFAENGDFVDLKIPGFVDMAKKYI